MRVAVVGVNFKSSELFLREQLTKAFHKCFRERVSPFPAVLLSTCNRSEIYFSTEDLADAHTEVVVLLRKHIELPFEHVLYSYFGAECFAHLAAVVAGLDSAILAETEIQGQVKRAYSDGCSSCALPSPLHFMFQKCLKIGKWIRTMMPLGSGNLEGVLLQLTRLVLKGVTNPSLLVIGNSEINRKMIAYFQARHLGEITLCTRAPSLAWALNVKAVDLTALEDREDYDVVICGTNRSEYLLSAETFSPRQKRQVIFDLSVPRNVDPAVGSHPDVHLFNIEELSQMVDAKQRISQREVDRAEIKIREEVEKQIVIFSSKQERKWECASI